MHSPSTDRRNAHLNSNSDHLEKIEETLRQSEDCLNRLRDSAESHLATVRRCRLAINSSRELLAQSRVTG
jgi:hypothetical protein